ncbi:MAG: hypothetical protein BJ554DRAFT_7651 [Olpidium bornovanus]|uniref:ABC transporter domain-containing protein n=1 Tax=Olpidium bornovanus TaxID=278681 RepID=A0A8H8A203_9FUNG|nr:MAG: hypothetical protein BJ554DRAFT_7651 [Olpidium bornovanus]
MGSKLGFQNASFDWEAASTDGGDRQAAESDVCQPESGFRLRDLNIEFPVGKLSVVTGKTGSGKSSLLSAIIGEMRCLSGKTVLPARPLAFARSGGPCRTGIAYVPQQGEGRPGVYREIKRRLGCC